MTLETAGDVPRWQRLFPGISLIRKYERGWLRGDLLAGVTVTAYLIPQVMAYAEVAGLPAVVGLWASVTALLVYAVLGSSPQLSVGPESTTALMTATALGGIAAGQADRYAALAAALAGLVGLFCLVAWAARLGFLADLLSRPVLVGYMSGVAVLMIISQKNQEEIQERWGAAPGEAYVHNNAIAFAGLTFGNIFVALQPPRGYGMDPNAMYHTPDLPPTHHYYALYQWLRAETGWNTDAIVHLGKHGTLEWLPGKSVGLSQTCYPDQLLADIPVIYPFIINNPGEGAQAKRRAHAVIIDHLIPPMTSAGAYGALAELAMMVDEYYQLEGLDPSKLPALQRQIWEKITSAHLDEDLKAMLQLDHGDHVHEWDEEMTENGTPATLSEMRGKDFAHLLEDIDGYLCELTSTQIRNGLHILGELPTDQKLTDLLFSLCRLPNIEIPGIREALARASGQPLASLLDAPGRRLTQQEQAQFSWLLPFHEQEENDTGTIHSAADALAALENCCRHLLSAIQAQHFTQQSVQQCIAEQNCPGGTSDIQTVLSFVCEQIMPRLQQVDQEITHILKALQGEFIPAGPSGSPTRGMVHVLPTGRNFYGLDPRAIPSQAAWEVGTRLAHELVERHRKESGHYPESVGISIWGTSALRTQGDDIAQIFALMGVRPRWQAENRRLTGIEVIPLQELGRPRIDVRIPHLRLLP